MSSDFYKILFVMEDRLFYEPQTEDYEYLLKLWGEDAYKLSPVLREQIAGVLRKVREKRFSSCHQNNPDWQTKPS